MNQIDQKARLSRKATQHTIRTTSLAGAVRTALFASGMALLASAPVYAQSCDAADTNTCSSTQGSALNAPAQDLTVVVDAALPSAVSNLATAADSAAITPAAASTVRIVNKGTVTKNKAGDVVGLYAALDDAVVTVINDGTLDITSSDGGLADGIFAAGAKTDVTNNGSISAMGYSWVAGIENQSSDSARIRNNGDIKVGHSVAVNPNTLYSHSYGIFSKNFGDGGSVVSNTGSISSSGNMYVTGMFAYDGGAGGLRVTQTGDISVMSTNVTTVIATGVFASTNAPGGNIVLNNSGLVKASSDLRGATGIAVSAYGDDAKATVFNSGTIYAKGLRAGLFNTYMGTALNVLADSDIAITNSADGKILAEGEGGATAVQANSSNGNIRIINSGLIEAAPANNTSIGVTATAGNGRIDFTNTGTLNASNVSGSFGARINGTFGATAINSGQINLNATAGSFAADPRSAAMYAQATVGNATVTNAGDINVTFENRGFVLPRFNLVTQYGGSAVAGGAGSATISNTGTIKLSGLDLGNFGNNHGLVAVGLSAFSDAGIARASNQGILTLKTPFTSNDAVLPGYLTDLRLPPGGATGLLVSSTSGAVTVNNSGNILISYASTSPPNVEYDPDKPLPGAPLPGAPLLEGRQGIVTYRAKSCLSN